MVYLLSMRANAWLIFLHSAFVSLAAAQSPRARARDLGVAPGIFKTGALNAITDVAGVRVGQVTLNEGEKIRTGITAIFPHAGNPYLERVPAAVNVGNGFGKLTGSTQVNELGEIETPILLTCTLCVWKAADAMAEWMLAQPGMERVRSINPLVAETNDGTLNDIRARPVTAEAVRRALESATGGPVAEGSVGAGTGTIAFGWKGGIGTSSRVLPASLGHYAFEGSVSPERGDGSCIVVIATDAPLSDRNLRRVAARAMMALGRTGSSAANGSGDYAIAFSTAREVRRAWDAKRLTTTELANDEVSGVFEGTVEAVEEAVYNSLFMATTTTGNGRTIEALPLDRVRQILEAHGITPKKK